VVKRGWQGKEVFKICTAHASGPKKYIKKFGKKGKTHRENRKTEKQNNNE